MERRGVVVALGLLLVLLAKESSGMQQFEKQPEYTEVNPETESRLVCKIYNKKGQCSWQKDGKPVGIYAGKYEWAGNPDAGDCSLRIFNSNLDYDDGEWECQVTASDFQTQDALTSRPVRFVVRVAPSSPQVEHNTTQIQQDRNFTTKAGVRTAVKCISRYGNPPALLKWFIGEEEILEGNNQTNTTELDRAKTWMSISILEYTFQKDQNDKTLRCVALHEAYTTKSREIQVRLDVQYLPIVKLQGSPSTDLEEGKDSLTLRCTADANPPAHIVWRKLGAADTYNFQESVEFRPVVRRHAGTYVCEAKNTLGSSDTLTVDVDVKYPPKITQMEPASELTVTLYERATFICEAEGNPPPVFQWLQRMSTNEETVYVRGSDRRLVVHNVTYDYQGDYVCKASNLIAGVDRTVQSEPITMNVVGAPQVLRHSVEREVVVEKGHDALIPVVFCANPRPNRATWEWGSIQLVAGAGEGRYVAEEIRKEKRDDCYEARLRVLRTDAADARNYYLQVENDHGADRYAVALAVRDPVSMATVMGIVIGCLILLVIVVLFILYAFKTEKWCFSQRGDFKPTDLESEKSDAESTRDSHNGKAVKGSSIGPIPQDAIYSSPKKPPPNHSDLDYENMKVRQAAAILQPPTTV